MTRLVFLSPNEKRKFDSPPTFNKEQRPAYFVVSDDIRRTLSNLHTTTNKVGFLLQLGYFKNAGKFFVPTMFRRKDINFVKQLLNITEDIDFGHYPPARMVQHRSRIMELLGWKSFNESSTALVADHVQMLAQQQLQPDQIFIATVDFCWKQRIEIPTYHQLSTVITDSFNIVESKLLSSLSLQAAERAALDALMTNPHDHWRPLLSEIKHVNQSLRAQNIQQNVNACQTLASYFCQFQSVFETLELSDQATEYYSTWVLKAKLTQLKQFPDPQKRYLHLLAFIKHQYFIRQDVLMDIFLKSVRTATNAVNKQLNRRVRVIEYDSKNIKNDKATATDCQQHYR